MTIPRPYDTQMSNTPISPSSPQSKIAALLNCRASQYRKYSRHDHGLSRHDHGLALNYQYFSLSREFHTLHPLFPLLFLFCCGPDLRCEGWRNETFQHPSYVSCVDFTNLFCRSLSGLCQIATRTDAFVREHHKTRSKAFICAQTC